MYKKETANVLYTARSASFSILGSIVEHVTLLSRQLLSQDSQGIIVESCRQNVPISMFPWATAASQRLSFKA